MWNLIRRHMHLFFTNPAGIVLSFAGAVVVIALYLLFVRDFTIQAVADYGMKSVYNTQFVDAMMLSGFILVVGASASLNVVATYIKDKEYRVIRDFYVTPIHKESIFFSYVFCGVILSLIMMLIVFVCVLAFLRMHYHLIFSWQTKCICLFYLLIGAFSANGIVFLIAYFLNSLSAFSSFSNLYGVIVGFLVGVYIPIGYYPAWIQTLSTFFPLSSIVCLLRNTLCSSTLKVMRRGYSNAVVDIIKDTFGFRLQWYDISLDKEACLFFALIAMISLYCLLFFLVEKRK